MDLRKISLWFMSGFYVLAGLNHFINPDFYLPLIPGYFGAYKPEINLLSGVLEVGLGIGVLFKPLRKICSWLIIALLVCFIPSHVYFIQIGSCVKNGLCIPEWVSWVRLLLVHPLLILWAWWNRVE